MWRNVRRRTAGAASYPRTSPRRFGSAMNVGRSSDLRARRLERRCSYWSSLPGPYVISRPVLGDDGRSRLPLRGSPGFTPGSLLSPLPYGEGYRRSGRQVSEVLITCQAPLVAVPLVACERAASGGQTAKSSLSSEWLPAAPGIGPPSFRPITLHARMSDVTQRAVPPTMNVITTMSHSGR